MSTPHDSVVRAVEPLLAKHFPTYGTHVLRHVGSCSAITTAAIEALREGAWQRMADAGWDMVQFASVIDDILGPVSTPTEEGK